GTSRSTFVVNGLYRLPCLLEPGNTAVGITSRGCAVILLKVIFSFSLALEISLNSCPVCSSRSAYDFWDTSPFAHDATCRTTSASLLAGPMSGSLPLTDRCV